MTELKETMLIAEIAGMSDNQLIDRAAHYNANVRRGRQLVENGQAMIAANINLFMICQNQLHDRTRRRIEHETDREFI